MKTKVIPSFEVVTALAGFTEPLVTYIDAEERSRLLASLQCERDGALAFYNFALPHGLECHVNLACILCVNVLDYFGGTLFPQPPAWPIEENGRQTEDREISSEPVILRIWTPLQGKPKIYRKVDHADWRSVEFTLRETDQDFVGFDDEDGERVLMPLSKIAAIEVFDTYYLHAEQTERFLRYYERRDKGSRVRNHVTSTLHLPVKRPGRKAHVTEPATGET
ncbi:MAG: hypothetical protein FGM15_08920 [Chthoniobacterales bacterium]|nr:hypothetical protein [Chthoniobacterales bacterium]